MEDNSSNSGDSSSSDSSLEGDVEVLNDWEGEIQVEPDAFEDYFHAENEDTQWLSEDHLFELQTAKDSNLKAPPPLTTWKEAEATVEVEVTVAKARRLLWEQGQTELQLHVDNVKGLPPLADMPACDGINRVYYHMFGSSSKLCRLFVEKAGLTPTKYLEFIATFIKSCRYKMSVPNLHAGDDHFPLLMPAADYNGVWSTIATLPRHAHGESFWQEVEAIFNRAYKELFMGGETQLEDESSSTFQYVLGLDDDKLHYNYNKNTASDGLKKGHHAKDNRHGFTAHTACHSATAAPCHVSFQRKNETVRQTTERMLEGMFGVHTGRANRLDNVEIAMDRGYWEAGLLFRLLDQGANVHGTVKRMDWVPLTFDRKGYVFPDKPRDIALKGFKDAFYMHTKWKGKQTALRKLTCVGYRSGTGNAVSLAVSSKDRRVHWDLVPHGNSIGWYHDRELPLIDRQKKAVRVLDGEDPHDECLQLLLTKVEPRTCEQGTVEWFIDRQLSGTSSTIAELVIAVAAIIQDDDPIFDSFKTVLDYSGHRKAIGSALVVEDDNADEEHSLGSSSDESNEDEADDERKKTAEQWVATLLDESIDMDQEFLDEAEDMEASVLSWIVALLKKKEYKLVTAKAAVKTLKKDCLAHPKPRRPYEMQTVADLKKLADQLNIKAAGLKKEALIDQLIKPEAQRTTNSKKKGTPKVKKADIDPDLLPLYTLLQQSFLRPQMSGPRAAAAIGHRNEEPFLKSFFSECHKEDIGNEFSFSSINPVAIFRLGLVRKKGSNFAKASLDGVTFITDADGDLELLPTEVKSRVSVATMNEAKDRVEELVGAELYNARKKYLISVRSGDPLLQLLISDEGNPTRKVSESFQLLHGTYVAGARQGLLLVGSKDALMYGVKVDFDEDLLNAYRLVVDYIYDKYVKIFFESTVEELKASNEEIPKALELLDYMDTHAFWTNYMLWRAFNVNVNSNNIKFPLPACARCLPFQNAKWNILKGPSDTTTKLLDAVEENLGMRTPRTIATARLLGVGLVAVHRSNQMLSAKSPSEYATLYHYRVAANNRYTMAASLTTLIAYVKDDYKYLVAREATAGRVRFVSNLVPPNTPPRRTRAALDAPERVTWMPLAKTGYTPTRGRSVNEAHKLREQHCDGRVLVAIISDPGSEDTVDCRQKCRLCGTKTNHYCTGCKNYLCFGVSQGLNEKRLKSIIARSGDDELTERHPKLSIKMTCYDPKTDNWNPSFAKNCCYLIQHRHSFDALWEAKHTQDEEEENNAVSSSSII